MAKKKYNPFKMWGSYVGILGAILLRNDLGSGRMLNFETTFCASSNLVSLTNCVGTSIFFLGIGFLVGWGVHSLIRRLRK